MLRSEVIRRNSMLGHVLLQAIFMAQAAQEELLPMCPVRRIKQMVGAQGPEPRTSCVLSNSSYLTP
ncbi:MAG: hypothetical protein JWO80_6225 [Bryobacterales bacterium]|nr:hypothetical protein [Bryobacterales bacterium]